MRPIRKEEMEYLYNDIKENFNDQKDIIKSNMIEEIDKLSSKNEIKFINKLNVQSKTKTVKEAYELNKTEIEIIKKLLKELFQKTIYY